MPLAPSRPPTSMPHEEIPKYQVIISRGKRIVDDRLRRGLPVSETTRRTLDLRPGREPSRPGLRTPVPSEDDVSTPDGTAVADLGGESRPGQ